MPRLPGIQERSPEITLTPIKMIAPAENGRAQAWQQLGETITKVTGAVFEGYQRSIAEKEATGAQKELQEFTLSLQHGGKDEEGNDIAPPAPELHEQLYNKKVQQITEKANRNLMGTALQRFNESFTPFANQQSFVVKSRVIDQYKGEAVKNLEASLLAKAQLFVASDNDTERAALQGDALQLITQAEDFNNLTPQQAFAKAQAFHDMTENGLYDRMLNENPKLAVRAMMDEKQFRNILPDKRQLQIHRGLERIHSEQIRANSIRDSERVAEDRARKLRQESTSKEAEFLLRSNKLTLDWVDQHREDLDDNRVITLVQELTGHGAHPQENEAVLRDFYEKARNGTLKESEVWAAKARNELTFSRATHFIDAATKVKGTNLSNGLNYIGGTVVTDPKSPFYTSQSKRKTDAEYRYTQWVLEHPNATSDEAHDQAVKISEAFNAVDFQERSDGLASPDYFVKNGGRAAYRPNTNDPSSFDVLKQKFSAAAKWTKEQFEAKKMNQREYDEQVDLINSHYRILKRRYEKAPLTMKKPNAGKP